MFALRLKRGYVIMEDAERKEFYKGEIIKLTKELDNLQLIEYFYYFMSAKIKAGQ